MPPLLSRAKFDPRVFIPKLAGNFSRSAC